MKKSHKETIAIWEDKLEKVKGAKRIKSTVTSFATYTFLLDGKIEIFFGTNHCPLCIEYGRSCKGCPVDRDEYPGCKGSPYDNVNRVLDRIIAGDNPIRTLEKTIAAELKYLKGVLS